MTTTSHLPRRRLVRLALALALVASAAATVRMVGPAEVVTPPPAGADPPCGGWGNTVGGGVSIGAGCGRPGSNGNGNNGSSNGGGNGNGSGNGSGDGGNGDGEPFGSVCGYVTHPDQSLLHYYQPDAPEGAVLQYYICPPRVMYTEDTRWVPGDEAGPVVVPPSPEEVAQAIWVEVRELLVEPALATSPAPGTRAVLRVPTFVAVTNMQEPISRDLCDTGVCVTLTATPSLSFDPGDGSDVIACDPPGTRFDPDGAPAADQAGASGACAHTYTSRTGVAGRPAAWPGEVSVDWEVAWTAETESGSLPGVTLSTELPRAVDEVTGLVTEIDGG